MATLAGYVGDTFHSPATERHTMDHYDDHSMLGVHLAPQVAGILLGAAGFLILMKVAGFRAMIAVGRN